MRPTFNLVREPWIPCIRPGGAAVELGLAETLTCAHTFTGIEGRSPVETAALYRLLLAVLHRVFGPRTQAEWVELWEEGRFDPARLEDYFSRWEERFDLFDPQRPFYQTADDRVQPRSALAMMFEMAAGNNATLFDHHTDEEGLSLKPAEAARALAAYQAFGLSGICHPQKNLYFTAAPAVGGILFLIEGDSLFETLMLNLLRYNDTSPDENLCAGPQDAPIWERDDPFSPIRKTPLGYLDYLTWPNRRIMLFPEKTQEGTVVRQITTAPGLEMSPDILDPLKHYRLDPETGYRALRFQEEKALWRDSAALLRLDDSKARPPLAFRQAAGLVIDGTLDPAARYRTLALGMANDKAKVEFLRLERVPLPAAFFEQEDLVALLERGLADAAATRNHLRTAVYIMASLLLAVQSDTPDGRKADQKDISNLISHWGCDRLYWSSLETAFLAFLEDLPTAGPDGLRAWQNTLQRSAWQSFDHAARLAGDSTAALKAAVQARGKLAFDLKKQYEPVP